MSSSLRHIPNIISAIDSAFRTITRQGRTYTPFPDIQSYRIGLSDLEKESVRKQLAAIWTDPLALDPARPFPKILNKSLNFAVVVEGEDGFGRNSGLAVVQAPRSLPRLIRLPDELGSRNFVFLATIVFTIFAPQVVLWIPKHVMPQAVGCFKNPSGDGYICPP